MVIYCFPALCVKGGDDKMGFSDTHAAKRQDVYCLIIHDYQVCP